jgi:dUTP pyrophosphatase
MNQEAAIALKWMHPELDTDIPLPRYMTPHSAGMDVCAAVTEPLVLHPGDRTLVPTGFALAIPMGYEAQIRPRSGLAVRHGITVLNAPGTIDSDYRGEVKIALIHLGDRSYTIERGERIAQMVIQKISQAIVEIVNTLDETSRNQGGFGSTGTL